MRHQRAPQSLVNTNLLFFLVVCLITTPVVHSKHVNVTCSEQCHCGTDADHRIWAKCDLRGVDDYHQISLPQDMFSLDLSSNGLKYLPMSLLERFPNISYLSLANNSFSSEFWLDEFTQLRTLNLSSNGSNDLAMSFFEPLPNISYLSLANNSFHSEFWLDEFTQLRTLDLSSNGFKYLPMSLLKRFPNISYLSLANNSFQFELMLDEFTQLRTLDMSYNQDNQYWSMFSFISLNDLLPPNLETLFIKNTKASPLERWEPYRSLLKNSSIRKISGVSWLQSCDDCNITKGVLVEIEQNSCRKGSKKRMSYQTFETRNGLTSGNGSICLDTSDWAWDLPLRLKKLDEFSPSRSLPPGYTLQCMCDRGCVTKLPSDSPFRFFYNFWSCLYPIESFGFAFNLVIIVIIPTSKELRKLPSLLLTLNMAVCDLLIDLWCVLSTASFSASVDGGRLFNRMCPYMKFILAVTHFTVLMTSVFLTVERYLVIVYCMKPQVRLNRKITCICMFLTWCVAVPYGIHVVIFGVSSIVQFNFSGERPIWHSCSVDFDETPVNLTALCLPIVAFTCTLPLYIHIYFLVRKSSVQMGVKREGALAMKLALLVFTNLLFSTLPMSLTLTLPKNSTRWFFSSESEYKSRVISRWVLVLLLSLNSCLNPFLFAFRHHKFKRQWSRIVSKALPCFRNQQGATRVQQHPRLSGHNPTQDTAL